MLHIINAFVFSSFLSNLVDDTDLAHGPPTPMVVKERLLCVIVASSPILSLMLSHWQVSQMSNAEKAHLVSDAVMRVSDIKQASCFDLDPSLPLEQVIKLAS